MILTEKEIFDLIQSPSNQNIKDWKEENTKLSLFTNGGKVSAFLEQIKNYENLEQKNLRDKLARSTKDMMAYLLNPINKIFSATGHNNVFDFKNKSNEKKFKDYIKKIPEGISMFKWMETYWKQAYISDPNSIILIESDKDGNAYPTYKSIQRIRDYKKTWENFEYIIFEPIKIKIGQETVDIFRVYDDEKDAYFKLEKNIAKKIENIKGYEPLSNELDFIPAVSPSDNIDTITGGYLSFIFVIDEVLGEYLNDSSVHSIYKFLHGFPIFWSYAMKCVTCNGTGKVKKKDSNEMKVCPTCNGRAIKVSNDVSDGVRLPIPTTDQPKLAPDIAGYVSPDDKAWNLQLEEMQKMRKDMHFALWGTYTEDEKSHTATGRFIDEQPVNDALWPISDSGQNIYSTILGFMSSMMYQEDKDSCTAYWGKRFLIETPDQLWDKYILAKEKEAPLSALDDRYKKYLNAEYRNDADMLDQKMKEMFIEPYPHYTIENLKDNISPEMMARKIMYSDWVCTNPDFTKKIDALKTEFKTYFITNYKPVENGTVTES